MYAGGDSLLAIGDELVWGGGVGMFVFLQMMNVEICVLESV